MAFEVTRGDLRKRLAELEARRVIVRRRRTGTVVAPGAMEIVKVPVHVGRKDLAGMEGQPFRLLKNVLTHRVEDEVAGRASSYRLVPGPYVDDLNRLRAEGRPTICGCGGVSLPQVSAYGLCEDLTEQVESWPGSAEIWPNLWESVRVNGRILALPSRAHVFLLFANVSRLKACGLDPASPPGTWDELVEAALRMTDAGSGRYGLALPGDRHLAWGFTDFIFQSGGRPILGNGLSWIPAFHEPAGVRAATFLRDLRWRHNVLLPDGPDSAAVARAFFEGRAGMCVMEGDDMFNLVLRQGWGERETAVWPLPAGPDGHELWHVSVNAEFINRFASPAEKAAAWDHLAAMNGRDTTMRLSRLFRQHGMLLGFPPIFRDCTLQETGMDLPQAWFRTARNALARALQEPGGIGWNTELYLKPVLRRILEDPHADPQRELERAAAMAQPGLALT